MWCVCGAGTNAPAAVSKQTGSRTATTWTQTVFPFFRSQKVTLCQPVCVTASVEILVQKLELLALGSLKSTCDQWCNLRHLRQQPPSLSVATPHGGGSSVSCGSVVGGTVVLVTRLQDEPQGRQPGSCSALWHPCWTAVAAAAGAGGCLFVCTLPRRAPRLPPSLTDSSNSTPLPPWLPPTG